jgi:hypothetical protein
MSAEEALKAARAAGVHLGIDGDQLVLEASVPPEAVLRDYGVIVFATPTAGVRLAIDVAAQRVIRDQN